MKFTCDGCKTRYSIADEKVRGKVLKIRCKTCAAVITLRDAGASQPAIAVSATGGRIVARPAPQTIQLAGQSAAGLAAASETTSPRARVPEAPEEWYLSVDGAQEGPLTPEQARARVQTKAAGVEMFAWRDDFEEWLPVEDVPVLAVHLPRRRGGTMPPVPEATPPPEPAPEAPAPGDPGFDFHIGEASRLVKLPILPPPPARSAGDSLPGVPAAAGAEASLKLPIASLSSEMASQPAPPVAASPPRPRRRLGALVAGGAAAVAVIVAVVVLAGLGDRGGEPRPAEASSESVVVTNFYRKDPPAPVERAPVAGEPVPEEEEEGEPATEPARSRRRRPPPREAQVALAPPSRAEPARIGAARRGEKKVDSFGAGEGDSAPLSPDDVRATYAANEVGLKRCYERALKADPETTVSKMVVTITITAAGTVSDIQVPPDGGELAACVATSLRNWRFRKSTGEFTTEFTVFFAKRG
jgi:predicted Zn finger-like uncharacterized protein